MDNKQVQEFRASLDVAWEPLCGAGSDVYYRAREFKRGNL